jgi:phage terminase Nu1 subunit (DNA packaging protein)
MEKQVLQIEILEVHTLLSRLNTIKYEIDELKRELRKAPTDYLTRSDVANLFTVSLVTVSDWTAKGLLKSYKLANRVYYKRGEIEQALTEITPKR